MSMFSKAWANLKQAWKENLCPDHKWDGPQNFGARTCSKCGAIERAKRRSF